MSGSWLRKILVSSIHTYQQARLGRPSPCRFVPSCSEYAVEAVTIHGPYRGVWLAMCRVARCRPFGGFGSDPVPAAALGPARRRHQDSKHSYTTVK